MVESEVVAGLAAAVDVVVVVVVVVADVAVVVVVVVVAVAVVVVSVVAGHGRTHFFFECLRTTFSLVSSIYHKHVQVNHNPFHSGTDLVRVTNTNSPKYSSRFLAGHAFCVLRFHTAFQEVGDADARESDTRV